MLLFEIFKSHSASEMTLCLSTRPIRCDARWRRHVSHSMPHRLRCNMTLFFINSIKSRVQFNSARIDTVLLLPALVRTVCAHRKRSKYVPVNTGIVVYCRAKARHVYTDCYCHTVDLHKLGNLQRLVVARITTMCISSKHGDNIEAPSVLSY